MASSTMPSWKVLPLILGVDPRAHIWNFSVRVSDHVVISDRNDGCVGNSAWVWGQAVLQPDPETTFTFTIVWPPAVKVALPALPGAFTRISTRLPGAHKKTVGGLVSCG